MANCVNCGKETSITHFDLLYRPMCVVHYLEYTEEKKYKPGKWLNEVITVEPPFFMD